MFDCCFNDSAMDLEGTEGCMGADPITTRNDGGRSAPAAPGHRANLQLPVLLSISDPGMLTAFLPAILSCSKGLCSGSQ